MERTKSDNKRIWILAGIVLGVVLLGGLAATIFAVWKEYSTAIMNQQKAQMSITVDSIASNIEHEMKRYNDDVNRLMNIAVYSKEKDMDFVDYTYEQYLANQEDYVTNMVLRDGQGKTLWCNQELSFSETYSTSMMQDGVELSARKGSDGELYFVFCQQMENGTQLEMDVLIRSYYEGLMSKIKIGSNGYLVLKTSQGTILMHPLDEQWGLDVIEGRESLYHVEDLKSLNDMTRKQLAGETGVEEYVSYWWGHEDLPKVKKIAAYQPAYVGDDYLVVSAVIDYDEVYRPILGGVVKIGIAFFGMLIVLIVFLVIFSYLAIQKRKNQEEIEYLKDLNTVLEKTRQSEEAISHQQRLQIMGTMTGGIAHEFNNMLTPVMGYADMLLDLLTPGSEEYEYAQEIFDASDRAKDVIQQISSLSRKNMETVFTSVSVKKLLNRTLKMIHSVCPANVRLTLEESFTNECFLGNETQMKQVILNLCINAFHAIGKAADGRLTIYGYLAIRREMEALHQIQIANEWDFYLCIRVSDNGCGISPEMLEEIFTPFFTTKKSGSGTGLGLSVVEQIVHTHKGYICVKSQLGKGSDFYIYLPKIHGQQRVGKAENRKPEGPQAARMRVLIADDNEKILQLLKKEMGQLQIDVKTVETPEEAQKELEKETYQLLLIDRTLGENHSGINFAMSIQNQYPGMKKILMADQVKKEVIEANQRKIIDAYVQKPVSAAEIIEKMRELDNEEP